MSAPFLWQMISPSSPGAIMTEDKKAILALTAEVAALQTEVARLRLHEDASAQFLAERDELRVEVERLTALLDVSERKLGEWRDRGAEMERENKSRGRALDMYEREVQGYKKRAQAAEAEVERLRVALRGLVDATRNEMNVRGLPVEWDKDSALGQACAALAPEVK